MLKRYVSLRRLADTRRSKTFIGFSCVLLVLLTGGFFLSSFVGQHRSAHAAKPAVTAGVSKTWYFADGRVGSGFREYITIGNPDPTADCTATISYLPEGEISSVQAKGHMAARKPLAMRTVSIPHASRYTASVNQDLGVSEGQQASILHSTVVTVAATSGCAGVVVERPMYFSYQGVSSGSDVMGTTSLGETFYFADVPTQAGASSFVNSYLTVLNPSPVDAAFIEVNYYAQGGSVSYQSLHIAPGARATIHPGTLVSGHVTSVVKSNIMVAVERASYLHNMQEGAAGTVSSAASVVGSQQPSNDWLFAEGYTGGQSQENLLLSNPTRDSTTATVTLEYQNTHHQILTVPVPAYSEVPVDVNAANVQPTGTCDISPCVTTPEVSAEVTATSNSLVVERQMFFHYAHTIPNTSISTTATGGTEVQGTLSPATTTANFAEGYTNVGYNEWLTLQNPTGNNETLALRVTNELGRVYTQNVLVTARSRSTVDVTALVLQYLVHQGDNYRAYQVSMNVQTASAGAVFVAERPMYFSLSKNIQGGTDVVGFVGAYSCVELNTTFASADSVDFMTVGPDGNVWSASSDENWVAKVTPYGAVSQYLLPAQSGIKGITTGSDGNLWITERYGNKIAKITTFGVITEYPLPNANSTPEGITKGPDGNVWFSEYGNGGKIGKITPTGVITEYSIPTSGAKVFGMTAGPDGNIWFVEYNKDIVGRITPAGDITEFSTGLVGAQLNYITTGPDGNLWFTEYNDNVVGRITPTGTITTFTQGISAGSGPYGITVGPDGNLWFTEDNATAIGIITPAGTVVSELNITTENADPAAIALGTDSNIWFSDYNTGLIGRCAVSG